MIKSVEKSLFEYYGFSKTDGADYSVISGILKDINIKSVVQSLEEIQKINLPEVLTEWLNKYEKVGERNDFICKWTFQGMKKVTLDSVDDEYKNSVYVTKTKSIILNYLLDDLIDRRKQKEVLEVIINSEEIYRPKNEKDRETIKLARDLWQDVQKDIKQYPKYSEFRELFFYDYEQFFNALRYSFLLNNRPFINNLIENQMYLSHNMQGIISIDIDLMASPKLDCDDLPILREIAWFAQRLGRIGNSLTTWEREVKEDDFTSEIFALAVCENVLDASDFKDKEKVVRKIKESKLEKKLLKEWENNYRVMSILGSNIKSFSLDSFMQGLRELIRMHLISTGHK